MTASSPPIVSIVGRSGAGKTTLLERLVPALRGLGLRVAAIKHDAHRFDLDYPGKDSWRLTQAGAEAVLLGSPERIALMERTEAEWSVERLAGLVSGRVDLVLTEGYRRSHHPKVEVVREEPGEPLCRPDELWAVVSSGEVPSLQSVRRFAPDDPSGLAALLLDRLGMRSSSNGELKLEQLLRQAAEGHGHLCPGQVLGVRMALLGCRLVGVEPPDRRKRLMVFVEIDRCATDAIQSVTGCRLGKRTLRHLDYGKLATTFLNLETGLAYRVAGLASSRERAWEYVPGASDRTAAQLAAYRIMPDEELFSVARVEVPLSSDQLPGRPHSRVPCGQCGEEISDGREVRLGAETLCRPCSLGGYYAEVTNRTPRPSGLPD